MRFRAIGAFHTYNEQRIDPLTEMIFFVVNIENPWPRQPNEVGMRDIKRSPIRKVDLEGHERDLPHQTSEFFQHAFILDSQLIKDK